MRLFSLAAAAVTASGLFLATPAESRADHRRSSFGISVGSGSFNFSYGSPGYSSYYPGYSGYSGYSSYVVPSYSSYVYPSYSSYAYPRASRYYDDCYDVYVPSYRSSAPHVHHRHGHHHPAHGPHHPGRGHGWR